MPGHRPGPERHRAPSKESLSTLLGISCRSSHLPETRPRPHWLDLAECWPMTHRWRIGKRVQGAQLRPVGRRLGPQHRASRAQNIRHCVSWLSRGCGSQDPVTVIPSSVDWECQGPGLRLSRTSFGPTSSKKMRPDRQCPGRRKSALAKREHGQAKPDTRNVRAWQRTLRSFRNAGATRPAMAPPTVPCSTGRLQQGPFEEPVHDPPDRLG